MANCVLKFSIGYFYLRVAIQRWHILAIKLLMAGTVFFGLVYFFLVMLQCLPSKIAKAEVPIYSLTITSSRVLEQPSCFREMFAERTDSRAYIRSRCRECGSRLGARHYPVLHCLGSRSEVENETSCCWYPSICGSVSD